MRSIRDSLSFWVLKASGIEVYQQTYFPHWVIPIPMEHVIHSTTSPKLPLVAQLRLSSISKTKCTHRALPPKKRRAKQRAQVLRNLGELVDKGFSDASEGLLNVLSGALLTAVTDKDALNDSNLGGGGLETAEDGPVVGDYSGADSGVTTVDGTGDDGDLEEGRDLIHIGDGGTGVDDASEVGDDGVGADQGVLGDGGTEGLDLEGIADNLLGLAAEIGVDQADVIVADAAVTEGGEALLDAGQLDVVGEGVTEVLELLIGADGGHDEAVTVTNAEATNDAGGTNGGVDHRDVASKLLLEDGVEVLAGSTGGDEAVRVGEAAEDTDVIGGLEAGTESHDRRRTKNLRQ